MKSKNVAFLVRGGLLVLLSSSPTAEVDGVASRSLVLVSAEEQGSHYLENQGKSGNFELSGMSGNFSVCQGING